MLVLGIESSCDETAAAIVVDGAKILSSVVASQIPTHERYGGVVPELASREHLRKIEPVVDGLPARASRNTGCGRCRGNGGTRLGRVAPGRPGLWQSPCPRAG